MPKSAKNETTGRTRTTDAVHFVVVYNKPGRLVPSRLRTPQGAKGLMLGLVVLVLSHWDTRERWWVIEMTITSSMNTFSNTGNIPTLHQPTVTVTTVTHTHWLPTAADPHHFPQIWFGSMLALLICTYYVLQDIAKCSGYEDVSCCKSNGRQLGSWKRAVTTADGTWQTRGWHSKNATFTIRNYLNRALLYYHHLCQKGRDKIVEGDVTSHPESRSAPAM